MVKGQYLKDKQLNKVSGGGVINLMNSDYFADYIKYGILPPDVTEEKMLEDMNFAEHVFDKGNITPKEKETFN